MDNIGRAFTYMFEDKGWVPKILIGALMVLGSVVIIPYFLLLGYFVEVVKRSSEGNELPLPEWDDWGDRLVKGILFFVVTLIYGIPVAFVATILSLIIPCIGSLLALGLYVLLMVAMPYVCVRFARSGKIEDALDFGGLIEFIKANFKDLIIVAVISLVIGIIAGLGFLALGIGILVTYFWAFLATGFLFGNTVRTIENRGGAVIETAPPDQGGSGE